MRRLKRVVYSGNLSEAQASLRTQIHVCNASQFICALVANNILAHTSLHMQI